MLEIGRENHYTKLSEENYISLYADNVTPVTARS